MSNMQSKRVHKNKRMQPTIGHTADNSSSDSGHTRLSPESDLFDRDDLSTTAIQLHETDHIGPSMEFSLDEEHEEARGCSTSTANSALQSGADHFMPSAALVPWIITHRSLPASSRRRAGIPDGATGVQFQGSPPCQSFRLLRPLI